MAHNINEQLNKSGKSKFKSEEILSLIVYYSTRGLLDTREPKIMKKLYNIIGIENPLEDKKIQSISPLYIDEEESVKGLRSKITNLIIKSPFSKEVERDIAFTPQFNEMMEIIHFGLANNVPVILEGMPGQGKQLCINYIADLLGYDKSGRFIREKYHNQR